MAIEEKDFYSKEEVQNLINKSIASSKRRSKANWKKGFKLGASLSATIATLFTIVIAIVANNVIDKQQQNKYYYEYGKEIVAMVSDNKQFNYDYDKEQPAVYYESSNIAKYLVENDSNFDIDFFKVYNVIKNTGSFTDAEIRTTMNGILSWINTFYESKGMDEKAVYDTFEKYVVSLGFVDENNEADYKKYDEAFKDMIAKIKAAEIATEQYDIDYEGFGGRK